MTNYEVTDLLEIGDAGALIRDKETIAPDEVAGSPGPFQEDLDSD